MPSVLSDDMMGSDVSCGSLPGFQYLGSSVHGSTIGILYHESSRTSCQSLLLDRVVIIYYICTSIAILNWCRKLVMAEFSESDTDCLTLFCVEEECSQLCF